MHSISRLALLGALLPCCLMSQIVGSNDAGGDTAMTSDVVGDASGDTVTPLGDASADGTTDVTADSGTDVVHHPSGGALLIQLSSELDATNLHVDYFTRDPRPMATMPIDTQGNCSVYHEVNGRSDLPDDTYFDGSSLTFTVDSNRGTWTSGGGYSHSFFPSLAAGTMVHLESQATASVPALSVDLSALALQITAPVLSSTPEGTYTTTFTPGEDFVATWSAAAPTMGEVRLEIGRPSSDLTARDFIRCTAAPSAGTITVPWTLLSPLGIGGSSSAWFTLEQRVEVQGTFGDAAMQTLVSAGASAALASR